MYSLIGRNYNNAAINNYLWKSLRPYFALLNPLENAEAFLRNLWTVRTRALKIFATRNLILGSVVISDCFVHILDTAKKKIINYKTLKAEVSLTLRRLMSYIYGAPILDVSRSHTTTQHSR